MARMLGICQRDWCFVCRRSAGLDCCTKSWSKKTTRARKKREWRRDVRDR